MKKWKDLYKQRKILRLKDFDYTDSRYVYFLTICARHKVGADRRVCPFEDKRLANQIIESLIYRWKRADISLYCYCLMPDHLHIAVSPKDSKNLSTIIKEFKTYTTQIGWKYVGIKGKLWQKGYYDHIARRQEDLVSICRYILANPVRKGLVEDAEDWQCSGMIDPLPW